MRVWLVAILTQNRAFLGKVVEAKQHVVVAKIQKPFNSAGSTLFLPYAMRCNANKFISLLGCLVISAWSVPSIHPTSELCHSPLQLPGKHCMPQPTPQHDINIQPPLLFISRHALTSYMCSPPQASHQVISSVMFACINVLHAHPMVYLFAPPPRPRETSRKA